MPHRKNEVRLLAKYRVAVEKHAAPAIRFDL
jgi:hypothetical protein